MKRDLSREILHFYLGNKKMRVLKIDRPLAVGFVSGSSPQGWSGIMGPVSAQKKLPDFSGSFLIRIEIPLCPAHGPPAQGR